MLFQKQEVRMKTTQQSSRRKTAQKTLQTPTRTVPELLLEIAYQLHARKVISQTQTCDCAPQAPTRSVPEMLLEITYRLHANKAAKRPGRSSQPLEVRASKSVAARSDSHAKRTEIHCLA